MILLACIFLIPFLSSFGISLYNVETGTTVILKGTLIGAVLVLIVAIGVLITASLVMMYKTGKFPSLPGVISGRVNSLANASILAGIALLGVWGGALIGQFSIWSITFSRFNPEVLALGSASILVISGSVALWMGKIDPPADTPKDAVTTTSTVV
ncbi:MAG: hypothetical protein LBQ41_00565 [Candidatus Ancillula sp.]|jgi:hypothetical protein|nr:hypothetical protein [Candidatus Ancillula sp.]